MNEIIIVGLKLRSDALLPLLKN